MNKLICLLLGHNWTEWHQCGYTLISWRCLCKRCGKVWSM